MARGGWSYDRGVSQAEGFFLVLAGWLAGFVDAIAGGGGLITLPALLGIGLPPAEALATNKLQSTFGSASATWHYRRAGLVSWAEAWPGVVSTAVGAGLGVWSVSRLDPEWLRRWIPFLLLFAAFIVWRRPNLGQGASRARVGRRGFLVAAGLGLGFYDGFFGPGTGTFWTVGLVLALGFELLRATAWTKSMNFTSNLVSLVVFMFLGRVDWVAGLLMGVGQALGARWGARVALRGGSRLIRPMVLVLALLSAAKLIHDAWLR